MISLADLQRRIDAGDLSADAAIAQSREAIAAQEKTIGAFVCHDANVRAQSAGPLRGIAVGIKDIIDTAGLSDRDGLADLPGIAAARRCGGCDDAEAGGRDHHRQDHDDGVRLARSDARRSIRTITATRRADRRRARRRRSAAGMIPLALGTQTGGSVIRPASFCGVAAIKPSYRLLPTVGVKCYSWTLDTVGLFAAGVDDLARGLSAMTGRPELLPPASHADAAHRRRDAGFCRRAGSRGRGGAADRGEGGGARRRFGARRWRCPRSSPRRGASIRSCRNSRRIRRSPGNTARITTRWRRCCAAGSTKARA